MGTAAPYHAARARSVIPTDASGHDLVSGDGSTSFPEETGTPSISLGGARARPERMGEMASTYFAAGRR